MSASHWRASVDDLLRAPVAMHRALFCSVSSCLRLDSHVGAVENFASDE